MMRTALSTHGVDQSANFTPSSVNEVFLISCQFLKKGFSVLCGSRNIEIMSLLREF